MVQFIKILEYELNPSDEDVFEYLCKLTNQSIDPPTKSVGKLETHANTVLHSPLRRSTECLKKKLGVEYRPMEQLREISFKLDDICSREEWIEIGESIVRRNIKKAFTEDKLLISRENLFRETREILEVCKKLSRQNDLAVVSHSFRLKFIEAYVKTRGEIENNPELIEKYILDNEKTYEFGGGFFWDF